MHKCARDTCYEPYLYNLLQNTMFGVDCSKYAKSFPIAIPIFLSPRMKSDVNIGIKPPKSSELVKVLDKFVKMQGKKMCMKT